MNPDDLHLLMRNASNVKTREYIERVFKSDHTFFERLCNMFEECQFKKPLADLRVGPSGVTKLLGREQAED